MSIHAPCRAASLQLWAGNNEQFCVLIVCDCWRIIVETNRNTMNNETLIQLNASIAELDKMLADDTELKAIKAATKLSIRSNIIAAIIASVSTLLFTLFI
jgi:hypothetical protein